MNIFTLKFHYKLLFFGVLFLCFFIYPTIFTLHTYKIVAPATFILTITSFITLICGQLKIVKNRTVILSILGAYFIPLLLGFFFLETVFLHNIIIFSSYIIIPLVTALLWNSEDNKKSKYSLITKIFALVWLVNALFHFYGANTGLPGNRNWFSQLTLCTSFFAVFYLYNLNIKDKLLKYSLCFLVVIISLYLIYVSHSRAVWLGISAIIYLNILFILSFKKKILFLILTTLATFLIYFSYQNFWQKIYDRDIRGPLYQQSMIISLDSPSNFLIGVGAGNFRKEFVKYRSTEHKNRAVSGLITEHPHNEFLWLMNSIGMMAAFIWLFFSLKVIFSKPKEPFLIICHFSFIGLFTQGMLDKVLTNSQTSLIFPILLGILLAPKINEYININWNIANRKKRLLKIFTSIILSIYLLYIAITFTLADYYFFSKATLTITNKSVEEIEEIRNSFELASNLNPYKIKSYLTVSTIDLFHLYTKVPKEKKMALLERSEKVLEKVAQLEPNYLDINKLRGYLYMQKYFLTQNPIFKKQSLQEYKKYSEVFSDRGDRLFERFINLVFLQQQDEAIAYFPKVLETYSKKFNKRIQNSKKLLINFSEKSINRKNKKESLKDLKLLLTNIVEGVKDPFFDSIYKKSPLLSILRSHKMTDLDNYYWYQYIYLYKATKSLSLEDIIKRNFKNTNIDLKNTHYQLPITQWKNPITSSLANASLLALCGTIKGYDSYLMINKKNDYDVIFIKGKNYLIVDLTEKKLKTTFSFPKNMNLILNTFPQEFRVHNSVLQQLLLENLNFPKATILPSIRLLKGIKQFSNKTSIHFLTETNNFFIKKLKLKTPKK